VDHTRHLGIFNLNQRSCTIIGAGGIGAITALTLAKMGMSYVRIFDRDTVDDVNLPTQFHKVSDIGKMKVDAVRENIALFSDETEVIAHHDRVNAETDLVDWIVISAVDSINARKEIWKSISLSNPAWYLDARMASEVFQLYAVPMDDLDRWRAYNDALEALNEEDVPEETCTMKATMFCACVAAGIIGSTVRKIATAKKVPFLLNFDIFNNALTVI
jgi:molybdopterin/thiamine biosynthesis adenylyltransferase